MPDDPAAILAHYQMFIDRYRHYQRVLRASVEPDAKNMDEQMWDALEAIDEVFDPIFERDDNLIDLTIAAMRLDNQRRYESREEMIVLLRPTTRTPCERFRAKRGAHMVATVGE